MNARYLCQSWQSLIQMVVYYVSRGYLHYCITLFPTIKQDRWESIDQKLMTRYHIGLSKWQKARRKHQGFANFVYLRWGCISIILHTAGNFESMKIADVFHDIRRAPIHLSISPLVCLSISVDQLHKRPHTTVRLCRDSYRGFKEQMHEIVKAGNVAYIKREFAKINGLPCYRGIIEQKRRLAQYVISQSKKRPLFLQESDLRIRTRLTRYSVYINDATKNPPSG